MTGTPSEPSKEELRDDLAGGGEEQPPTTTDETPSEEAQDKESAPKKTKKKKKAAPERSKPKPIARVIALLVLIGIPVALIFFSGRERGKSGGLPTSTRWSVGSEQDIHITLIAQDKTNLSCASSDELGGKHCEYEAKDKKWSKGGSNDDKSQYKPYRLVGNNDPVLIAGLWSEPALKGALPNERFSAHCKLKVEGKLKKPTVRWGPKDPWYDEPFDWPAGSVSNCTVKKLSPSSPEPQHRQNPPASPFGAGGLCLAARTPSIL